MYTLLVPTEHTLAKPQSQASTLRRFSLPFIGPKRSSCPILFDSNLIVMLVLRSRFVSVCTGSMPSVSRSDGDFALPRKWLSNCRLQHSDWASLVFQVRYHDSTKPSDPSTCLCVLQILQYMSPSAIADVVESSYVMRPCLESYGTYTKILIYVFWPSNRRLQTNNSASTTRCWRSLHTYIEQGEQKAQC